MGVVNEEVKLAFQSLPFSDDGSLLFALDDVKSLNSSASLLTHSAADASPGLLGRVQRTGPGRSVTADNKTAQRVKLVAELEQAVLSVQRSSGADVQPAYCIAHTLAKLGFHGHVILEGARGIRRSSTSMPCMPFRPFLLVLGREERTDLDIVVEPDFRAKFEISDASPAYSAATALLPEAFIGRSTDLQEIVSRMGRMMKKEFAAKRMSLPPWRSASALMGIWHPLDNRQRKMFAPT